MAAIGAWLVAGAWKWLLPVVALVGALGWGEWQHIGWVECQAKADAFAAQAAKQAADFKAADDANGKKISDAFAAGVASLTGSYQNAVADLAKAKAHVVPGCNVTDSARSFDSGVRSNAANSANRPARSSP